MKTSFAKSFQMSKWNTSPCKFKSGTFILVLSQQKIHADLNVSNDKTELKSMNCPGGQLFPCSKTDGFPTDVLISDFT